MSCPVVSVLQFTDSQPWYAKASPRHPSLRRSSSLLLVPLPSPRNNRDPRKFCPTSSPRLVSLSCRRTRKTSTSTPSEWSRFLVVDWTRAELSGEWCSVVNRRVSRLQQDKRCADIAGIIKNATKAKVAVYTCGLDISQTETKGTVLMKNAEELLNFTHGEEKQLEGVSIGHIRERDELIISTSRRSPTPASNSSSLDPVSETSLCTT